MLYEIMRLIGYVIAFYVVQKFFSYFDFHLKGHRDAHSMCLSIMMMILSIMFFHETTRHVFKIVWSGCFILTLTWWISSLRAVIITSK